MPIKALFFDVFGTCVDWRTSIARQGETFGAQHGLRNIDWLKFADAWRALYEPQMELVRGGSRPWTKLDDLHRESLDRVCAEFGIAGIASEALDGLNRAWHRLDPWPDVVEGLKRLKSRYIIAPNSNGNIALITNMAKHARLPWDVVLGAETARAYKPLPASYLRNVELLDLKPEDVMMVAAHNYDLVATQALGLKTAFVSRPTEHGPGQIKDLEPERSYDVVALDFLELAAKLGC